MGQTYCVYKHTAPNGKVYIGITKQDPVARWKNGKNYKDNPYFTQAINKYGWNNIQHEIIESGLTKETACEKEQEYIRAYNSTDRGKGYNILCGGDITPDRTGSTASAETRKKMSNARKGKRHSEEHCKHIADALRGRELADSHKEKATAALRKGYGKNKGENNGMFGKHGAAHPASRRIAQMTKDGAIVAIHESTRDATKTLGLPESAYKNIGACANGAKNRPTAYGYVWRYANV